MHQRFYNVFVKGNRLSKYAKIDYSKILDRYKFYCHIGGKADNQYFQPPFSDPPLIKKAADLVTKVHAEISKVFNKSVELNREISFKISEEGVIFDLECGDNNEVIKPAHDYKVASIDSSVAPIDLSVASGPDAASLLYLASMSAAQAELVVSEKYFLIFAPTDSLLGYYNNGFVTDLYTYGPTLKEGEIRKENYLLYICVDALKDLYHSGKITLKTYQDYMYERGLRLYFCLARLLKETFIISC